jgi:hypothetical protein
MGATEEAGKAVGGVVSALGGQPVLLVQALIIGGIVFLLYAQGTRGYTERQELLTAVFDSQKNVREILSQCIVPPDERNKRTNYTPLSIPAIKNALGKE